MTGRAPDRPAWLDWLTTVAPPVTLVVALLVYFAQVRRIAQSSALGFDASVLREPSIPEYLSRSVGALYTPLVALTAVALVVLWADRRLRRKLDDRTKLRLLVRVSLAVPLTALSLVVVVVALAFTGPLLRAYAELVAPFLLAVAVLAVRYGNSLRAAVRTRLPTSRPATESRLPGLLLSGFLVALLLFAGVDGFAKVVGRGLARQVIDHPELHTRPVLVYCAQDLQLDPADATRTTLPGEQGGYRYRYDGLRLVFVDAGSYFLIPRTWQRDQGKLIVLRPEGLRVEFLRSP